MEQSFSELILLKIEGKNKQRNRLRATQPLRYYTESVLEYHDRPEHFQKQKIASKISRLYARSLKRNIARKSFANINKSLNDKQWFKNSLETN